MSRSSRIGREGRLHVLAVGLLVVAVCLLAVLVVAGSAAAVADEQPPHEHPDDVDDEDQLDALQEWLADRLAETLVECAAAVGDGDADPCEALDDEFASDLERYATVEADTTPEEDRQAGRFESAGTDLGELVELHRAFDETLADYRAASDRGDEREARERARELRLTADRVEELDDQLAADLHALDPITGPDLQSAADSLNETNEEIAALTREIEQEVFDTTDVSVTADDRAAFDAPATVSGELRTENGTAIADGRIVVEDDETTSETRTDQDGSFSLAYRPTVTAVGETEVTVRYVPDDESDHLPADATVRVDVAETASTVAIDETSAEAGFGDTVAVDGVVRVADTSVEGVPVVVLVDDEPLASGRTDEDGRFAAEGSLPVTVAAGEATVTVRASEAGLAVGESQETATMTVVETATDLVVTADTVDGTVDIAGRLTAETEAEAEAEAEAEQEADANATLGERPLTVTIDGEGEHTVTTDDDGHFSLSTDVSDEQRDVVVEYDEDGTNLQSATATATIDAERSGIASAVELVGGGIETVDDLARNSPLLAGLVLAGVAANVVLLGLAWRSRRRSGHGGGPATDAPSGIETDRPGSASGPQRQREPSRLDATREFLRTPPKKAVQAGYVAVRKGFFWRSPPSPDAPEETAIDGTVAAGQSAEGAPDPDDDRSPAGALLAAARDFLEVSPETAVQAGYAAARIGIGGDSPDRTHWEFYRGTRDDLGADRASALRSLTESFEQATFAPTGIDLEGARAALDDAERCLTTADGGTTTPPES